MPFANTQILFENQTLNIYRLVSPKLTKIITQRGNYSFAIPYELNTNTVCQLIGTDDRVLKFIINLNGEISFADTGLVVISVNNGVQLEFFGFEGLNTCQLHNNKIIIT